MLPTPEALAADLTRAGAPHIGKLLARVGRAKFDKFVATYTNVFSDHLEDTVARCSTTKNILYRDPVPLLGQYVPNDFMSQQSSISDQRVLKHAQSTHICCLITGLAGSGKSMFMKWAALQLADTILSHQKIPLFIEARSLTDSELSLPLEQSIFEKTSSEKSTATFDQFKIGLEHSAFIVMIDGLDEINPATRDVFLRQVSDFRRRFPDSSIVCSSRPERQIESLADLQILRIEEMSLEQIKNVINNVNFSHEKKESFIQELDGGLYNDHKSFLSNPLLSIIMLITFDNNTNVPRKISAFYAQVFEALFFRHDSSKGVYTRKHFSTLEIDQFEEVFRSFSFETYALSRLRFSTTDLTKLIRSSLERVGISGVNPDSFIKDAKQSVCLLQDDGLETSFVHRSFQEYFAARYLLFYKGDVFPDVLDRISRRASTDNVLAMLYQMNSIEVKRLWIAKRLSDFSSELDSILRDDPSSYMRFVEKHFSAVEIDRNADIVSLTLPSSSPAIIISAILSLLRDEMDLSDEMIIFGKLFGEHGENIRMFLERCRESEDPIEDQLSKLLNFGGNDQKEIRFGSWAEEWVLKSNLPSIVECLRVRVVAVRDAVENQTAATDDFAADILKIMTG